MSHPYADLDAATLEALGWDVDERLREVDETETGERTLPMQHELKCWPASFEAIVDGSKTSEFRCTDDRHFAAGDTLLLREYVVPAGDESAEGAGGYTGQSVTVQVSHVDEGPRWGIPQGYAMLSVRPGI